MSTVSTSKLDVFRRCPRRYRYTYDDRRVPKKDALPLVFGSAFHKAMEFFWLQDHPAALAYVAQQLKESTSEVMTPEEWIKLSCMVKHYRANKSDYEVLGIEIERTINLGNGSSLICIFDGLLKEKSSGKTLILEHKTTSDEIVGYGKYWQGLKVNAQIGNYLFAEAGAEGILYDVARKPGLKLCGKDDKLAAEKGITAWDAYRIRIEAEIATSPHEYYQIRPQYRSKESVEDSRLDLVSTINSMDQCYETGFWKNPLSCRTNYGFCPYLGVCSGNEDLWDDNIFKNREGRNEQNATRSSEG